MSDATPLLNALVARVECRRGTGAPFEESLDEQRATALEGTLARKLLESRAAWPDVVLEDRVFLDYLADRVPDEMPLDEAILAMHVSDLYLVCACLRGDPKALSAFETKLLSEVPAFVAQIDRNPSFADEVRQQLCEKLFVPSMGATPKITEFTGRGPLGGWLRVSAVRTALNLRRTFKDVADVAHPSTDVAFASPAPDPELDYLKTRCGNELREALAATLTAISGDERNVLRMHYIDGLTIDEIGTAYRVHRSTVARWLAASREKILVHTKRLLAERLRLADEEVESMIGLVRSRLDVSIHRFLDETG